MATILIVDDSLFWQRVLKMTLESAGHRVIETRDGVEALEKVRTESFDLIFSDIQMPRMDGIEFVRQLRSNRAHAQIPVVFWTGTYNMSNIQSLTKDSGVKHILLKSATP